MILERIMKINDNISKIKNVELFKEIFELVQPELQSSGDCKYSYNNNGIFFDLRLLSDDTLEKIELLIKDNTTTDSECINYNVYCSDDHDIVSQRTGPKLSNIERNLMIKKQKDL